MKYSHKIDIYVIKDGELLCDVLYFSPFDNFKQCYTTYEEEEGKIISILNSIILTMVKIKSIKYVALNTRAYNKLRGDAISVVAIYGCEVTHDEISEKSFQGKNYITMNWFWKEKVKVAMMRVNAIK